MKDENKKVRWGIIIFFFVGVKGINAAVIATIPMWFMPELNYHPMYFIACVVWVVVYLRFVKWLGTKAINSLFPSNEKELENDQ